MLIWFKKIKTVKNINKPNKHLSLSDFVGKNHKYKKNPQLKIIFKKEKKWNVGLMMVVVK